MNEKRSTAALFGNFIDTPESIGWEQAPQAVPWMAKTADIAFGGPLVRGFMEAPASMPEAEIQAEVQPVSFRKGLTKTSEQLFGGYEVAPPEALTQGEVGPLPSEYVGEILPTAFELGVAYPVAGKVMAKGLGEAGRLAETADLLPEVAGMAGRQLASQLGAVGEPRTLLSWVRSKGGLWDETLPGEVSQFVKEHGVVGLVSKRTGRPLDELASQAVSEGWMMPGSTSGDLVEALKGDIAALKAGKSRVSAPGADIERQVARQIEAEEAAGAPELPKPRVEELPKYAGSVNLQRIDLGPDELRYINRVYEENAVLIDKMRRGTITHEETRAAAQRLLSDDLGLEVKWKKGLALNAEEITARRLDLATKTAEVGNIAKQVVAGNNTSGKLGELVEAINAQLRVQAETSAVATEAGRALSAMRIPAGPVDVRKRAIEKMLEAVGGREVTEDIARKIAAASEEGIPAVNSFIRSMSKATFKDKIFELYVNSLLSGPVTHLVNSTSNAITFLAKFPEKALAAGVEAVRAAATKTARERFLGEVTEEMFATWQGVKKGITAAVKAFRTELESGALSKIEEVGHRGQAIKGRTGRVVRVPGRLLMAADEFFKAVNFETELHGLAYRQAAREGFVNTQERIGRVAELLASPTEEMIEKATGGMLYRVFQQEYGPMGRAVAQFRGKIPGLRYVVPFLRTPINIAKYGLERTPLEFIRIGYKLRRGELSGGELSDQAAKAILGTGLGMVTAMYAAEGKISGKGPEDKAQRDALLRQGWLPYSVKIGDRWYQYGRLEPLGMVMGLAADYAEIAREEGTEDLGKLAAHIGESISQNLTSKTFLSGVTNLINALDDPQRYGEEYLKQFISPVVPGVAAQAARAIDPTMRRTGNALQALQARVPGMSEKLLPRLDLWGREIKRPLEGVAALSPVQISKESEDAVDKEFVRLKVPVRIPDRKIEGVKLTDAQHNEYIRLAGQGAKRELDEMIRDPFWKGLTDSEKRDVFEETIRLFRRDAKEQLLDRHPDLLRAIEERKSR